MANRMQDQQVVRQVQLRELEIMEQVAAICHKHGLTYFGVGGTVLGAVRHGGFIPWDDDMDIAMPRQDYEKFLRIAAEELPKGYHLQHFGNEPNTPFYFTKVRKDGTKFLEYYLKDQPIHHGIFVDIFPYDAIPEVRWHRKVHFRVSRILYQLFLCKTLDEVYSARFVQRGEGKPGYKHYVRKALHFLLIPVPKKWLFCWLDRWVQLYNRQDTSQIGYPVSKWLSVFKEDLYPIQHIPFDRIQLPVPGNYDEYLRRKFGDYWILPPEEARYGHLPYQVELETEET